MSVQYILLSSYVTENHTCTNILIRLIEVMVVSTGFAIDQKNMVKITFVHNYLVLIYTMYSVSQLSAHVSEAVRYDKICSPRPVIVQLPWPNNTNVQQVRL